MTHECSRTPGVAGLLVPVDRTVLVIDDDEGVRTALRTYLERSGYQVREATTGRVGLDLVAEITPDLVLVDLLLPDMHGFDVIRALRRAGDIPIIAVTGQADSHDVVGGLEAGADDYVTKPFLPAELRARIHAQLRRADTTAPGLPDAITRGEVSVHPTSGEVHRNGLSVQVTRLEFQVLLQLFLAEGRVVTRAELLDTVWGYPDGAGDPRIVDNVVFRLRSKLEDDPSAPVHLLTSRGFGFRWTE